MRSFVYRERRPFDPMRLKTLVGRAWPGVVRTKGFFWLATRPHHVGEITQAGALVRTGKRGVWWASVPRHQWADQPNSAPPRNPISIQSRVTGGRGSSSSAATR